MKIFAYLASFLLIITFSSLAGAAERSERCDLVSHIDAMGAHDRSRGALCEELALSLKNPDCQQNNAGKESVNQGESESTY